MRVKIDSIALCAHLDSLRIYIENKTEVYAERYVKLGSKIVKVILRDKAFLPQMERQLTWSLKDKAEHYDATIVVWQESDIMAIPNKIICNNERLKSLMHKEALSTNREEADFELVNDSFSTFNPVVFYHPENGTIEAVDQQNNIYYYGVRDPSPESFIKEGHIFVELFNQIVKTPNANLAHGACVGMDGSGVLLCGIGHRGKSTLTVLSMVMGMEYVSDDYQILEKENDNLYAYPFYSIITLSPEMYSDMYDDFKGKFISMNGRKDKYVFNISSYHGQFRERYPIKACLFPEIVADLEPSIEVCNPLDRNRAIAQLVGSTVRQMRDISDVQTIKKLTDMISAFPFYKIRLCRNLKKNVECLKAFCENLKK